MMRYCEHAYRRIPSDSNDPREDYASDSEYERVQVICLKKHHAHPDRDKKRIPWKDVMCPHRCRDEQPQCSDYK